MRENPTKGLISRNPYPQLPIKGDYNSSSNPHTLCLEKTYTSGY
ncbi:hypothetical protein HMPREF0454_01906 [Hafnia alvei ATCC 51873]|uniref:Uncharacterized protein n=1 Tax=Hafnia alvei ATCC 51873 TaxID=1002364 RepID=G9Y5N3_HAFAL|nr:hypothetical protein HMPREF0454_01906 [Hafnia alvei ATCC 51873]